MQIKKNIDKRKNLCYNASINMMKALMGRSTYLILYAEKRRSVQVLMQAVWK